MSSPDTTAPGDPGTAAPDFTLAVAGSDGATASPLAAHRGREAVVLYFVRAFT